MYLAKDKTRLEPSICQYFFNIIGWIMGMGFERLFPLSISDCLSQWYIDYTLLYFSTWNISFYNNYILSMKRSYWEYEFWNVVSKYLVPQGKSTPIPEIDSYMFYLIPTNTGALCSLKSKVKIRQGRLKLTNIQFSKSTLSIRRAVRLDRYLVCLFFSSVEKLNSGCVASGILLCKSQSFIYYIKGTHILLRTVLLINLNILLKV